MSTSIASDERWAITATRNTTAREIGIHGQRPSYSRHTLGGLLEDLGLALLLVLLCPVAILALGTPVTLFARLLIELAKAV